MKYNININQIALAESGLDIVDAALLDYLVALAASMSPAIVKARLQDEQGHFTWINYDHLIQEMPLLGLTTRGAVSKHITKLVNHKFIQAKPSGRRLYFRLAEAYDKVVFTDQPFPTGNETVSHRKRNRFPQETYNNTSDNNTSDNNSIEIRNEFDPHVIALTDLLFTLVKENYPFVNRPPSIEDFKAMDKLNRIDSRDWVTIEYIIKWCQQDIFWKQNIRSVEKLRKQFDTLLVRAKSDYDKARVPKVVSV